MSISFLLSMMLPSWATTWTITPGTSIQSTINASTTGDTFEIQAGTYNECLNPNGRDLSFVGIGNVLIDGSNCTTTLTLPGNEVVDVSDLEMKNTGGLVLDVSSTATASLSNVTVSSSGFSTQSSSSLGGVIYTEGVVSIENSQFTSNTGGLGGVIYSDGGTISVVGSNFSGNSALNGGVLYAKNGTTFTSLNNTFTNNLTVNGGYGGVFTFWFGVNYSEDGSSFENNLSDSNGGVLYSNHNFASSQPNVISIQNAVFDTNQAGNGSFTTGSGGALYIYNRSEVTITGTDFVGNTSSNGGALWVVAADSTLTISDSSFSQNIADSSGAIGVLSSGSSAPTNLDISNSTFSLNQATSGYGGAISLGSGSIAQSYGDLTIDSSLFEFNDAQNSSTAHGGAILVNTDSNSDVLISDTQFQENTADSSGGALYLTGAKDIDIVRSRFFENEASSPASYERFGGGVSIYSVENVSMNNLIFCGNVVTQYPNMTSNGGAVYIGDIEEAEMHNIIFQENTSDESGGALALVNVSDISVINNTFVGNSSSEGDAVWASNSPVQMINNIYSEHPGSNLTSASTVHAADSVSATFGSTYGDWYNNDTNTSGSFAFSVTGNGNITDDPLFTVFSLDGDCDNDNLLLDSSSTLIDAGDPNRFDLDGTRSDIGAFGGSGLVDSDGDGFGALVDCDDTSASTFPGAAFLESSTACMMDVDGDGYGEASPSNPLVQSGLDCDDSNFNIKPGAPEFCDGIDNDCNNQVDDNPISGTTYFEDSDNDGFGGSTTIVSCNPVNGASSVSGDCDDLDPFSYPGVAILDSSTSCMRDLDGDGYGDASPTNSAVSSGSDCDDTQASFNPDAVEVPSDGLDQNCDLYEDCFVDSDLDGYGSASITSSASFTCSGLAISDNQDDCDDASAQTFPGAAEYDSSTACMTDADEDGYGWMVAPIGGIGGNDCDDSDPLVYYGAPEIPGDGVSQDCDNSEDCYADSDGDGYGTSAIQPSSDLDCTDPGESSNADDCDDSDPEISPLAQEIPYDEIDQDCDPTTLDDDLDGDGYGVSDGDCDDADPDRNPGQEDIPDDGIDQDCDGEDSTGEVNDTGDTEDPDDTDDTNVDPETDTGVIPGTDVNKDGGCSSTSLGQFGFWSILFGVFFPRRRQR